MSFVSSGTQGDVTNVVFAHLAALYDVEDDQLSVSVEAASSVIRSSSSSWDVDFEIVAPEGQANEIFEATHQMVNDTSNFSASLAARFQLEGLQVDESSLSVSTPEIKIVTATMTTVSVTETTATATSTQTSTTTSMTETSTTTSTTTVTTTTAVTGTSTTAGTAYEPAAGEVSTTAASDETQATGASGAASAGSGPAMPSLALLLAGVCGLLL
jgi:hypothetical protein